MTQLSAFRSDCPIASTLDLVGDKWSLLIIRDMIFGARLFTDFARSAEGFPRNILTDRLRRLESAGVIARTQYQTRPDRFAYHLTAAGADLLPVIQALANWGAGHLGHVYQPPQVLTDMRPGDLATGGDHAARPD
jgi:DNA-binding HxlR family transcriptional regulator